MTDLEIHPELPDGVAAMIQWLADNHLPMPTAYELSGNAPSASRRGDLKTVEHALDLGAEYLVTNRDVCAVKDFGPVRLSFICHRWDLRSVPPSDRCLAVAA